MQTVDLDRNPKQKQFAQDLLGEVYRHDEYLERLAKWEREQSREGVPEEAWKELVSRPQLLNPIRYWFYGGAIRGGKTFLCLTLLVILCKKYGGSRWHVVRRSFPDLVGTTVPSLEKIVKYSRVRWKRSQGDYFCEFENGSRIYFMAESYSQDKDHNRFKGLETNGILLEQLEELQETMYSTCLQRIGSWYDCETMPPAFMFSTFNPTYNWVKTNLHDVWMEKGIEPPFYYMQALPEDNAFVTEDQWRAWEQLDDETYDRFIKGLWVMNIEGVFMHQFSDTKHLDTGIKYNPNHTLWFSFDFNVDPMTCVVAQTDGSTWMHVLKEYRISNSDTYEMCAEIKRDWPNMGTMDVRITGDASGNNRNAGTRHHINQYDIIHNELPIGWNQFGVATVNPGIVDSRTFCNSVFKSMHKVAMHPVHCQHLVKDMRFVLTGLNGQGLLCIQKTGMNQYANMSNSQLGHLLDCLRYFMHAALPNFIHIPKS